MYVIPQMPLVANIYRVGSAVPDVVSAANLAWGRRVQLSATGGTTTIGVIVYLMSLLLPAGTDVRGVKSGYAGDNVECPAGSGRFYKVMFVDDIGKGFPNEHRSAQLLQDNATWPFPTP